MKNKDIVEFASSRGAVEYCNRLGDMVVFPSHNRYAIFAVRNSVNSSEYYAVIPFGKKAVIEWRRENENGDLQVSYLTKYETDQFHDAWQS
jgi:hypothetical protein